MTDINLTEAGQQAFHEAVRALQIAAGEEPVPHWEDAEQWQRDATLAGVKDAIERITMFAPDLVIILYQLARGQHEDWAKQKVMAGWVHGEKKDAHATPPTHPLLVPFPFMSDVQKRKDMAVLGLGAALFLALPARFPAPEGTAQA